MPVFTREHMERPVQETESQAPVWDVEVTGGVPVMTAPLSPLQRRPFPTVHSLSPGDRKEAAEQRIPSLEQVLEAAKESNISIMFDLRPENHSDYQNFVNVTLGVILQSGIPLQQVSWSPPHPCQALLSHPCHAGRCPASHTDHP